MGLFAPIESTRDACGYNLLGDYAVVNAQETLAQRSSTPCEHRQCRKFYKTAGHQGNLSSLRVRSFIPSIFNSYYIINSIQCYIFFRELLWRMPTPYSSLWRVQ